SLWVSVYRETYIEQERGENANDRNDRAIRVAAKWYQEHLKKSQGEESILVILLTNDRKNKEKAVEEGITTFTCKSDLLTFPGYELFPKSLRRDQLREEYVKSLTGHPELMDRLACLNDEENEMESSKIIFPEHLPLSKLQQGIKSGFYLQGTFRASRDNYLEATVWIHGNDQEREPKTSVNTAMLRPTGRVVGIIKRNWRPYCGMLSKSHIKEGHFVKNLGEAGDKETETEVLLLEHDVPHQPFSQAVLSFLPQMPWSISDEDMKQREDLRQLCVCSVDPPGFAFSCIWEMNQNAEILATRFTKSVINSKASLTYAEAQMKIDSATLKDDVTTSLRGLNRLAKILKKRRRENGALTLSSPEVRFHIDSETHDPIDLQTKELKETNSMVEEFMLLANISVAQKINQEFSEHALLRKHPAPPPSNYDILGLEIKTDCAKSLADSLDRAESPSFPYLNTLLRILATRCMMQAVYFCSGMDSDFHHYGLASPIYTHFTSPIRRYADIIVHRLLAVAIGVDTTYPDLTDKHKLAELCKNLNFRHKMAQYAQRASIAFHTQLFFKNKGEVSEEAYILFVRKNAIVVLIPKYGLEGTVFFEEKAKTNERLVFNDEKIRMTLVEPKVGSR
ncbi:Exosome complex exonuclease RRP44, partial [Ophiophagus hannah]